MMRPQTLYVARALADAPVLTYTNSGGAKLNWTDGTPVNYSSPATWLTNQSKAEIGYKIERAPVNPNGSPGVWSLLTNALANQVTFTDPAGGGATPYRYRVTAYNAAGNSVSNEVLVAQLPGAPTNVAGTAGASQVALTWTAPADTGGLNITGYWIEWSSDAGATWARVTSNTGSANTSFTVTGLTPATPHIFRVRAITPAGVGPYSANSAPVTPFTIPDAPTNVVGVASPPSTVNLTWTAPVSDGGSPITGYAIEWSNNGGTTWTRATSNTGSTATAFSVAGLTGGSTYLFRVRANNLGGTSAWSAASAPVVLAGLPGAPTNVVGVAGSSQVALTWTAPANDGGSPITGYGIEWSSNGGGAWTRVTSNTGNANTALTVTGLTPGTAYIFRVRANNAVGIGAWSANSAAVTPYTVPGAPTNVVGAAGSSRVSLTWTAPASNGGRAISGYGIEWSSNGGGTWTRVTSNTGSADTAFTVTGLTPGTAYIFRVRANNVAGSGAWSANSAAVTPYTVPGAPTGVAGVPGVRQIALTWTAPANGGSPITGYAVERRPAGTGTWTRVTSNTGSTATSFTVTGLTTGDSYQFRVRAINVAGTSAWSAASPAVTAG